MEDQKHYVIVDNETYELYDGNGSFYVTKAVHPADSFPLQNNFRTLKDARSTFMDNFSVPAIIPESRIDCQSGQPLEPIIINDYGNMNYFTQAASDVTIYLNSNNQSNFMGSDNRQGDYFVDAEGVIDLTKFSTSCRHPMAGTCSSIPKTGQPTTLNVDKSLQNIPHEELDAPEFIDISKLNLSYINAKLGSDIEITPVVKKRKANGNSGSTINASTETSDDSDEVIFVKEFKANDNRNANKPLDLRRKMEVGTSNLRPPPRRNPKRQVQLLKESFDLALKLSDEEIYCGRTRRPYRYALTENTRRSSKNTGAVRSPPAALTNKDYKEWPSDGLHERPVFNMATKKIEKFDFQPTEDNLPAKKNDTPTLKPQQKGKKPGKRGKRKAPNRSKSTKKESPEEGISKEFAALTHETLQEVIKYVGQVKECNEILKGNKVDPQPQTETGNLIDDARLLLDVVRENAMEENLTNAIDLLTDSCLLYSLANDVCQGSVAKYLKSVKSGEQV